MNQPHAMGEMKWTSWCTHKCLNGHVLVSHEFEDREACDSITDALVAGTLECGECE